jgi:TetR/AcrR family transcriptional repressor of nem operon
MIGSRERLLQAADKLFLVQGYNQTSLDEILSASRVTKSNFYYHFKGKEELGLAIIDQWGRRMLAEWLEPLKEKPVGPWDRLRAMATTIADQMDASGCQEGCPFGRLAMELGPDHGIFRRAIGQFFEQIIDRVWMVIAEGQQMGQIRAELDARALAQLFLAQLEGAMMLARTSRHSRPIRTCFETFAKLVGK